MERIAAILLICSLTLSGIGSASSKSIVNELDIIEKATIESQEEKSEDTNKSSVAASVISSTAANEPTFNGLNDPELLQYVEDSVYTSLVDQFDSEDCIIENIEAIYISKEYLEEVAYNSQANIWFGFTLAELDEQFQGKRYVFTLGDNYETTVQPLEDYEDTYKKLIKNVDTGMGVILLCVTVSVITAGAGLDTMSMLFAASAIDASRLALSSGGFGAVAAGTMTGIKTGDMGKALEASAIMASEGFKWGAIAGAVIGGAGIVCLPHYTPNIPPNKPINYLMVYSLKNPKWEEAEKRVLDKYPGKTLTSFLKGKEVPWLTPNATRPDIVRTEANHLEAIEVKRYNLNNSVALGILYRELQREVLSRNVNLPFGSTQRIVLDVTDRGFSPELVADVVQQIQIRLMDVYPNIPIDVVGLEL